MAPGSATLAVRAVAVASFLAMLVLPSLGRCPSLGPEPPMAAPAPAPGPAQAMRCDDCGPHCISTCRVSVPLKCSKPCDAPSCDECRSDVMGKCRAGCTGGSCDCDGEATRSCYDSCSNGSACTDCMRFASKQCSANCNSQCAATCV
ncbi:hypothetical protein VPH35_075118 [Triticum aestivum]